MGQRNESARSIIRIDPRRPRKKVNSRKMTYEELANERAYCKRPTSTKEIRGPALPPPALSSARPSRHVGKTTNMHTDRPAPAAQTRPRVSHPTPARRLCVSILRAASPLVPYPPYCQCWDATRRACSALPRQRVRGGIALSRGQYRVPNLEGVLTTKELVPCPV